MNKKILLILSFSLLCIHSIKSEPTGQQMSSPGSLAMSVSRASNEQSFFSKKSPVNKSRFTVFKMTGQAPDMNDELRSEWIKRVKFLGEKVGRPLGISDRMYNTGYSAAIRNRLVRGTNEKIEKYKRTGREDEIPLMLYIQDFVVKNFNELWQKHLDQLKAQPPYYYYFAIPELKKVITAAPGEKIKIKTDETHPVIRVFQCKGGSKAKSEASLIAENPEKYFNKRGMGEQADVFYLGGKMTEEWIGPASKGQQDSPKTLSRSSSQDSSSQPSSSSRSSDAGSSRASSPAPSDGSASSGSTVLSSSPVSDSWFGALAAKFKGHGSGGSEGQQKAVTRNTSRYRVSKNDPKLIPLLSFVESSDNSYEETSSSGSSSPRSYGSMSRTPSPMSTGPSPHSSPSLKGKEKAGYLPLARI